jgi:hypothetical protein
MLLEARASRHGSSGRLLPNCASSSRTKIHELEHTLAFEKADLLVKAADIDALRCEVSDV